MPPKKPHEIPLGFEGGRQHFKLDERGRVRIDCSRLGWLPGRDSGRCLWSGEWIEVDPGLPGPRVEGRRLDDYLPMMVGEWEADGVRYRQTAFVTPLRGVPEHDGGVLADDTLVLLARIEMFAEEAPAEATLVLRSTTGEGPERVVLRDEGVVAVGGESGPLLRLRVTSPDPVGSYTFREGDGALEYHASLGPDAPARVLDLFVPYITLTESEQVTRLEELRYESEFESVHDYWSRRVASGTRIRTPVSSIDAFFRAHGVHLLINTEREVGHPERSMARVGSLVYGVFPNESSMMVAELDRRGFSERARRVLAAWIAYQGTRGLPGDYASVDGVFYGSGGYEADGYNQHHGWVLRALAEHYRFTRDADWLRSVAPAIVRGCDWIIRERARTVEIASREPLRAIERGLLPPGAVEDITDWRSWLVNNVYSWWGMANAAEVLQEIRHPQAARLARESRAYREDILTAFTEAMNRSPLVRLRDGSWVPHIPSEVHRRGRSYGWITETLEGAIHLIRTGMIEPHDPRATWILRDYEDNLYLSDQYGYRVTPQELERTWFDHGGISMQANLLCGPWVYLMRDEIEHFLRAYFNAFAASYFPDTAMMTEHALPLGGWAGDHFKTSDEANSAGWLRQMFLQERGEELWIGAALPRRWLAEGEQVAIEEAMTHFGAVSVTFHSRAATGVIEMSLDPPVRNPPKWLRVRFRHPEKKRMVRAEVDGVAHPNFDPDREWVMIPGKAAPRQVVAYYE
jgi:hypothetical protein